jgi:tetratricopeptide (TPR) repeat protein/tRNA A-37 threonylcarbamoyl transferase component Bud32
MVRQYALVRELGKGGMGIVYEAFDTVLRRKVAIKMILDPTRATEESLERFRREAQASARFRHEGIVELYEVGRHEGKPYLVMELIEGENLEAFLRREKVPPRRMAEIVRGVALALAHAHERRVLHRDVKPVNVLLDHEGKPHLTDFGIARDEGATAQITVTGDVLGTPAYMAPEQARGSPNAQGPHTDIYALGGLLYRGLVGRPPFQATNAPALLYKVMTQEPVAPSRVNAAVHRDLETITLRCLAKEPVRRYPTAGTVAEDLRRFLEGEPILARPTGPLERAFLAAKRHRLVPVLGLVLVLSGAMGAMILERRHEATLRRNEVTRAREEAVAAVASFERTVLRYHQDTAHYDEYLQQRNAVTLILGQRALDTARLFYARAKDLGSDQDCIDAARFLYETAITVGDQALTWDDGLAATAAFRIALDVQPVDSAAQGKFARADRMSSQRGLEAQTWAQKGSAPLSAGLIGFAKTCFDHAVELDGDCAQAHFGLGNCALIRRRWDEAEREFTKAIELKPTWANVYLWRGEAAGRQGGVERALADFARSLRLDPEDPTAYSRRAQFYVERGEFMAALRDLDDAVQRMDSSRPDLQAQILDNRGALRYRCDDLVGAEADLTCALELEGVLPAVWEHRAEVRLRRHDRAGAMADLNRFLELAPPSDVNVPRARRALAELEADHD